MRRLLMLKASSNLLVARPVMQSLGPDIFKGGHSKELEAVYIYKLDQCFNINRGKKKKKNYRRTQQLLQDQKPKAENFCQQVAQLLDKAEEQQNKKTDRQRGKEKHKPPTVVSYDILLPSTGREGNLQDIIFFNSLLF